MRDEKVGNALIVGALMVAVSLVGASWFVSQAIDRASDRLGQVTLEMTDLAGDAGKAAAAAADTAPQARRPRRPDPERRYDVEVGRSPARGNEDAAVTIVEWSDFQCPFCSRVWPTLARIEKDYGDQVRIVFKHMPLPMHTKAPAAHAAAEAAHRQGRFWEMHDRIFASQSRLDPQQYLVWAEEIGLDVDRFQRDVAAADTRGAVDADVRQAAELGVTGTPSFFINGRFLSGAQPYESFKRLIDEELRKDS